MMFFEKIPFAVRLLLPILWYGLIFCLTELPVAGNYYTQQAFNQATSPTFEKISGTKAQLAEVNPIAHALNTVFRVGAHLFVFGILGVFVYFLIQPSMLFNFKKFWIAIAVVVLLGVLDEVHQTFVPGRMGASVDVVKDLLGAMAFVWLSCWLVKRNRMAS